ncbi:MAG: transcriptional regulator [Alphaproteobacteria bacterium]|nr:transcriptional regulator [Alphaproteobacteria bacterium]
MTNKKKTSHLAQDILDGLNSALAYVEGRPTSQAVKHVVSVPDVKAIREASGLSQSEFSSIYNIPLATLKGWEQRRRYPDATASAYIRTIALFPKEARRAQTFRVTENRRSDEHPMHV